MFNFLIQAYNTENKNINYTKHCDIICDYLKLSQNPGKMLIHICTHLDQNNYTGLHSYTANFKLRCLDTVEHTCLKILLENEYSLYPECFDNDYMSENMKEFVRKQYERDLHDVQRKYDNKDIDPVYFLPSKSQKIVDILETNGDISIHRVYFLNTLLNDMFIRQKNRYTGKNFDPSFYENIEKMYPYDYLMYYCFYLRMKQEK